MLVRFGEEISPDVNARVTVALEVMIRMRPPWAVDVVPAYASLLVIYDPLQVDSARVVARLHELLATTAGTAIPEARIVEIPVWYDPSVGPDLETLASAKGLTPRELADVHAAGDYRVYALGFRPGFPFLGIVDERLYTPRLPSPRPRVAAGSVGIAGRQTGIYPVDGPGGWRIVGRTPLRLFDLGRDQPFLLRAGDRVRFAPIDGARYAALGGR